MHDKWNKLIWMYNRDKLGPVTNAGVVISASPARDTSFCERKQKGQARLILYGGLYEYDEMRG